MLHTESLFLVDDKKSKIFEFDAVLQQTVSSDDTINLTRLQAIYHFLRFGIREKTRKHFNFDGVASKSLGKCIAVLCSEESGGH